MVYAAKIMASTACAVINDHKKLYESKEDLSLSNSRWY